jgi:hypothetical protein
MSILTKVQFEAKYTDAVTGMFPTNTTQAIGSDDLREFAEDIADSFVNQDLSNTVQTTPGSQAQVLTAYRTGTFYARKDISSAEVLLAGAGSTPVTIVGAPTSGYMIVPIAFHVGLDYNSVAYATNTTFRFEINGVAVSNTNTTVLPGVADRYTIMHAIDVDTTTNITGQPLVFEVQGGNPTAGNSIIYVGVVYKVVWSQGIEP